jgi:threonyl-tRNA synthetase
VLTDGDRPTIEKSIEKVIKEDQKFQRVVVTREEALSMFQENKFKVRLACIRRRCPPR